MLQWQLGQNCSVLQQHESHAPPTAPPQGSSLTSPLGNRPGNLFQQQQQLQHTCQQQQQQQQQQWVKQGNPVLQAKPTGSSVSHIADDGSRPPWHWEKEVLSEAIKASASINELQQLLPSVAAADQPEFTTKVLLQAVQIMRAIHSSGSSAEATFHKPRKAGNWWQMQLLQHRSDAVHSAGGRPLQQLLSTSGEPQLPEQQQQQQLEQLLGCCDVMLSRQEGRMSFQHVSGVLWAWSQLQHNPAAAAAAAGSPVLGDRRLLRCLVDRLVECPVDRELAGRGRAGQGRGPVLPGSGAVQQQGQQQGQQLLALFEQLRLYQASEILP
jgi:hypothetical protein